MYSRVLGFFLLILIFLSSCGDGVPKEVLEPKEMEALLVDIHLIDGQLSHSPIDSARMMLMAKYQQAFRYHDTDSQQFKASLAYYASRPGQFRAMYENVNQVLVDLLQVEQDKMAAAYRERVILDSIAAARHSDSLRQVSFYARDLMNKRDLLFRQEADSTRDSSVPFSFERYSTDIFESLHLWKLRFPDYFSGEPKGDSETRDTVLFNPQLRPRTESGDIYDY